MPYKNKEINPVQYKKQHTVKQSQFYVGFSTVNEASKHAKLYDFDLIKQDILNQFNIKKGERLMNPSFGTIIWDALFDPFTDNLKQAISDDVSRICNSDPRVVPIRININEEEYGMLLEVTLQYVGTNQTSNMSVAFDRSAGLVLR